jgi:hypothetical protein
MNQQIEIQNKVDGQHGSLHDHFNIKEEEKIEHNNFIEFFEIEENYHGWNR